MLIFTHACVEDKEIFWCHFIGHYFYEIRIIGNGRIMGCFHCLEDMGGGGNWGLTACGLNGEVVARVNFTVYQDLSA